MKGLLVQTQWPALNVMHPGMQNLPDQPAEAMGNRPDGGSLAYVSVLAASTPREVAVTVKLGMFTMPFHHPARDYTTVLDVVALVAFAGLYWLYRSRERLGGGGRYAKDPVCGMQVEKAHPGATTGTGDATVYFCSDHCRERYVAKPDSYART